MKRIVLCLGCVICILLSSMTALADVTEDMYTDPDTDLKFVSVDTITAMFSVSGGTATGAVRGTIKPNVDVDYVGITAMIKKSSGATVKTFTAKSFPIGTRYNWSDTYKLTSKGSYYMRVELKLYRSGKLIETIRKDSSIKAY